MTPSAATPAEYGTSPTEATTPTADATLMADAAPSTDPADLPARDRILRAALERFATDGMAGTSVRAVAADAQVSPPLVIHHFGSKDALRTACDTHVAAAIRARKHAAASQGPGLDLLGALREAADAPLLLHYLARAISEGSAEASRLVDEMIADAVTSLDLGVESGLFTPSEDAHARATVLVVWSLGALVLEDHLRRHLGAGITDGVDGLLAYGRPAMEILAGGALTEEATRRMRASADDDTPTPRQDPR